MVRRRRNPFLYRLADLYGRKSGKPPYIIIPEYRKKMVMLNYNTPDTRKSRVSGWVVVSHAADWGFMNMKHVLTYYRESTEGKCPALQYFQCCHLYRDHLESEITLPSGFWIFFFFFFSSCCNAFAEYLF